MLKLNMNKISNRIVATVSSEEALKDIIPIEWPEEVKAGNKKVRISKATMGDDNPCVKLETSY